MKPTTAAALGLAALLAFAALPSAFCQAAADPPASEGGASVGGAAGAAEEGQQPPAAPDAAPEDTPAEPAAAEGDLSMNPFLRGEQTIAIGAGLQIPLFIVPGETLTDKATNLSTGGSFSFAYQYFVARGLAIGGSIGGAFNGTIGGLSLFVAPLAFTTAYWWSLAPFEFDVCAAVGGYMSRHDGDGMLGPFAKLGGGAYWRSTTSWSLGLQTFFWLVPEIHTGGYSDLTRTSGFLEVGISALYHL